MIEVMEGEDGRDNVNGGSCKGGGPSFLFKIKEGDMSLSYSKEVVKDMVSIKMDDLGV